MSSEPKEVQISSPTDSPKNQKKPALFELIRKLLDAQGRRELAKSGLKGVLLWYLFYFGISLPNAIGEMLAIGVSKTIAKDGWEWFKVSLVLPGILALFVVLFSLMELIVWCAGVGSGWLLNRMPARARRIVTASVWVLVLSTAGGGLAITCARDAYRSALKEDPPVTSADRKTIEETREAAQKQSEAIKKFSETADTLMKDLDRTAGKVAETKQEIAQTMALFEKQLQATQEAQSNLARLAERQRVIETHAAELERILNGKTPITREDLDQSGRSGLWQGFVSGILTSLIATGFWVDLAG